MLDNIWSNKLYRFLLTFCGLVILWQVIYEAWLFKISFPDIYFVNNLISSSSAILHLIGYELINEGVPIIKERLIGVDGTDGIWIGNQCSGVSVIALYLGFLLAFPGKLKNKLSYLILGSIGIHTLNILRVVALCLLQKHDPDSLSFNHVYTFQVIVYLAIFVTWYSWVNSIGVKELQNN